MFKVEIGDGYCGVEESLEFDTLKGALDTVKEVITSGKGVEEISLWQEIPIKITVLVEVKSE